MNLSPPGYLASLLRILRSPNDASSLEEAEWDRVLRMARSAKLHGVLAHRLLALGTRGLPAGVERQLESAKAEALHARQMLLYELAQVRAALAGLDVELLVLKGAAYVVQDLDCAQGRMPADVDLLVAREDLDRVEHRLLDAGWEGTELDAYDLAYYRRWAHQVPPMRAAGHVMEVDLHHAILPPLGRLSIPMPLLWDASVALEQDRLRILSREDQVLHAVVHLFVDSDCTNRLRDLVDIGSLVTQFQREDAGFIGKLNGRAKRLGVVRPLEHAGVFLADWLGVPLLDSGPRTRSGAARAVRALMTRRLAPPDPDAMPIRFDAVHTALLGRSLWLRLPPHLALLHSARKSARQFGLR